MDAGYLFRRLAFGARFDFNKFRDDAKRFKLIKEEKEVPHHNSLKSLDPVSTSIKWSPAVGDAAVSGIKSEEEPEQKKQRLSDTDETSEDEHEQEHGKVEHEVKLLGHLTDRTKLQMRAKKRKKKKSKEKLRQLQEEQISHFRKQHRIFVWGTDVPPPIAAFDELAGGYNVHSDIINNCQNLGFAIPTPVQMQAIPLLLQRREVLACAPTGSGKTAAFLIPILHHLQKPRKKGFRAVVVSPTRELAKQTYRECQRLVQGRGLRIHLIDKVNKAVQKFGPGSSQKFDILITTPNRLVYLLKQEPPGVSLKNVEWLIIDESDKLFEAGKQGFRDQLAVIYQACHSPHLRRALFSATFAHEVESWCKLNLDNVVMVSVGARNSAVESVEQELIFVGNESGKLLAVRDMVKKGLMPPVLVFVQSKERAKELVNELIYDGINVDVIHSERTQLQRDNVVKSFRAGKIWVLICTELMGRGIDFKGVNLVINYDFPPSAISYIHRIGRTGRAGRPGRAVTFFTEDDVTNLRSIAQVMRDAGCHVPEYMLKLKKASREVKKKLVQRAPKRERVSTIPLYDIEKALKKKNIKEKSKLKKRKELQNQRAGAELAI